MRIRFLLCALLTTLSIHGQEAAMRIDSTNFVADSALMQPDDSLMSVVDSTAHTQSDSLVEAISQEFARPLPNAVSDTTAASEADTAEFKPVSQKSLWFAALCPGLGQIYNRRYWKLPIVAGAAVGVTYAITWNNKYYEAYTYAYRDMTDNDPNTNYHIEVFGEKAASQQTLFKNRQQTFRRQRDLSIIIGVAVYLLSILDAYVDAELFNFDISDDITLEMGRPSSAPPSAFPTYEQQMTQATPVSLSWHITF